MNEKRLLLCDFDGTLARGDSFVRFLLFCLPAPRLALWGFRLVFMFLKLFLSGQWSNEAGKAAVLSVFFKGKTEREMRAWGEGFFQKKMPRLLRPELLEQLREAHRAGHAVVLVSASPDVWLRPFCEAEGWGLLCTELEFLEGRFSGRFATPNCNGAEKARRIRAAYDLGAFEKIMAYGNSKGDSAMFALADEVFKF